MVCLDSESLQNVHVGEHNGLAQVYDCTGEQRAFVGERHDTNASAAGHPWGAIFLAHTPGLVRYGSKPSRDIARDATIADTIAAHLRSYEAAMAYPPNRAFLGHLHPDALADIPQPWFGSATPGTRWGAHGEIMPEEEFYGLLKICDAFDLLHLEAGFVEEVRTALALHPLLTPTDLQRLGTGFSEGDIALQCQGNMPALPLYLRNGRRIGCMQAAHEEDTSLAADVLLENLTCKASAVMAMRTLLAQEQLDPLALPYVLNSGEEAVGDRYQRGGGNLAKAVAESAAARPLPAWTSKAFAAGQCMPWSWPAVWSVRACSRRWHGGWLCASEIGDEIPRPCAA